MTLVVKTCLSTFLISRIDIAPNQHEHNLKCNKKFGFGPRRSDIANVADVPAILVGDESDIGVVVVSIVVPDVVEEDRGG